MSTKTEALWAEQNRHPGSREGLFREIADFVDPDRVLYPGSYVDIACSMVFDDVTYVDLDKRAAAFFADKDGVDRIISKDRRGRSEWVFLHADYDDDLGIDDESFDLLVSLYAGPISLSCARYLKIGGHLLVNPSHGDAALAALDDRYQLAGAVLHQQGKYKVRTKALDRYMVPKAGKSPTEESILASGRGVAYTHPAFAYVFKRVG